MAMLALGSLGRAPQSPPNLNKALIEAFALRLAAKAVLKLVGRALREGLAKAPGFYGFLSC